MIRILLVLGALVGCGAEKKETPEAVTSGEEDAPVEEEAKELLLADIEGGWYSNCRVYNDSKWFIADFQISENSVVDRTTVFNDEICTEKYYEKQAIHNIADFLPTSENTADLHTTSGKTSIVFYTPEGVEDATVVGAWGYSDWSAGVAKDITGRLFYEGRNTEPEEGVESVSNLRIIDGSLQFNRNDDKNTIFVYSRK